VIYVAISFQIASLLIESALLSVTQRWAVIEAADSLMASKLVTDCYSINILVYSRKKLRV
jgi:hypothetical protein